MAYVLVGNADVSTSSWSLLATVPAGQTAAMNVSFVNRGAANVRLKFAVGSGSAPAIGDYISFDRVILPNCEYEKIGMIINSGEKIWAKTDIATVSGRAHGLLEGA